MPRIEPCRNCRCKTPYTFWVEHDKLCERCSEAIPEYCCEELRRARMWHFIYKDTVVMAGWQFNNLDGYTKGTEFCQMQQQIFYCPFCGAKLDG